MIELFLTFFQIFLTDPKNATFHVGTRGKFFADSLIVRAKAYEAPGWWRACIEIYLLYLGQRKMHAKTAAKIAQIAQKSMLTFLIFGLGNIG